MGTPTRCRNSVYMGSSVTASAKIMSVISEKKRFSIAATSDGASDSASAVNPTMSAKSTLISRSCAPSTSSPLLPCTAAMIRSTTRGEW